MKRFIATLVILTTVYMLMVMYITDGEELNMNDRFGIVGLGAVIVIGSSVLLALNSDWFDKENPSPNGSQNINYWERRG